MKVLLSAFACAPGRGSEPGVGWGIASEVARRHDVWVLTDGDNRAAIEAQPLAGAKFTYIDLPKRVNDILGTGPVGWNLRYVAWQWQAFLAARQLHRQVGFDLVHHATYVNSWLPTWMGWLGPPFIWNAGVRERTPATFLRQLSRASQRFELIRSTGMGSLSWLTWLIAGTRSEALLSGSPASEWGHTTKVRRFFPNAVSDADLGELAQMPIRAGVPFRMGSIGRLIGWKGFALGIQAFARVKAALPDSEYWIVGDGPEREQLEALALELGCGESVRFLGWLPREETRAALAEMDVLVHPSLHDGFATVLLEAMAAGRPAVCLNVGGNAVIEEGRGLLVEAGTPDQVVDDLARELIQLGADPESRIKRGRDSRNWVQQTWTWSAVGRRLEELYQEVRVRTAEEILAPARA